MNICLERCRSSSWRQECTLDQMSVQCNLVEPIRLLACLLFDTCKETAVRGGNLHEEHSKCLRDSNWNLGTLNAGTVRLHNYLQHH